MGYISAPRASECRETGPLSSPLGQNSPGFCLGGRRDVKLVNSIDVVDAVFAPVILIIDFRLWLPSASMPDNQRTLKRGLVVSNCLLTFGLSCIKLLPLGCKSVCLTTFLWVVSRQTAQNYQAKLGEDIFPTQWTSYSLRELGPPCTPAIQMWANLGRKKCKQVYYVCFNEVTICVPSPILHKLLICKDNLDGPIFGWLKDTLYRFQGKKSRIKWKQIWVIIGRVPGINCQLFLARDNGIESGLIADLCINCLLYLDNNTDTTSFSQNNFKYSELVGWRIHHDGSLRTPTFIS